MVLKATAANIFSYSHGIGISFGFPVSDFWFDHASFQKHLPLRPLLTSADIKPLADDPHGPRAACREPVEQNSIGLIPRRINSAYGWRMLNARILLLSASQHTHHQTLGRLRRRV
jgi:hypothetical protein